MRRVMLFVVVIFITPFYINAAEDLAAAYSAGLKHDPRFQAARFQYEAARESVPQAYASLLPAISLEGRQGTQEQEILERDNPFFGVGKSDFPTSSFLFQVNQPIYHRATWLRLAQSKAFVRQSYSLFVAAEQELIFRTAEAYLNVLAARDDVEFTQTEQVAVAAQLSFVEARRRGGLATVTDEYEANARSARVEADLIAAEYAYDDAFQGLREVVGDAVSDVMELKENIPLVLPEPLHMETWIDRALKQNYELMARTEAVEVSDFEVKRRRSEHLPSLDLVARHGNTQTGGAVTGGGSDVNTTELMLQLSVPIYSGGMIKSQTREAKKLHQRALEERKLQHLVTMRATRAAFKGVRSSISQVKAFKQAQVSLESALAGRTQGYRSGVSTLLEVLDAERELTSIRRDYSKSRYNYLLNLLRLKQQTGVLNESDINYLNGMLQSRVE